MTTYYWESSEGCGTFEAESDVLAKEQKGLLQRTKNILISYRESDTEDGLPLFEI